MRDGQREFLSILIVGCEVIRDTESTGIQTDSRRLLSPWVLGVGLTSTYLDSAEEWGRGLKNPLLSLILGISIVQLA